jgi:hypothetical protein
MKTKDLKHPGDTAQAVATRQMVRVVIDLLRDTAKSTPEVEAVLWSLIESMKPPPVDGWAFEEFEANGRLFERVVKQ